jgi:selenide,water dikinase
MLINTGTVPILEGTREYAEEGLVPSGAYRNIHAYGDSLDFEDEWNIDHQLIFTDPQTNGGLLVSVAADKAEEYVDKLREMAYAYVAIIGEVVPDNSTDAPVVFRK